MPWKTILVRSGLALCIVFMLALVWFLVLRLEGEDPFIEMNPVILSIGKQQTLEFKVLDKKSGIRKILIELLNEGKKPVILFEKAFPSKGFGRSGAVEEESFKVMVEPKKLGFSDGKVILRMTALDYSWRRWWHGNKTYIEKAMLVDMHSPEVNFYTTMNYINQGGCGLVIYKVSETCPETGVVVGDNFYPGYAGYYDNDEIYLNFFALDYTQGPGTKIFLKATDRAGNTSKINFPYHIRKKIFKNEKIIISDEFLDSKMPEFDIDVPKDSKNVNLDKYLKVNRELRVANYNEIIGIAKGTENVMYWEGPFIRFPNSAPRAGFADYREYFYHEQKIDSQVHLGVDLASLEMSPVPAANKGKVAFAGDLGIYGKTVLIDHGFGLFSMYSHLSNIEVEPGKVVSTGDNIGRSGTTGLAGGDHLHFSMFLHNTFVNPIEWWDGGWIKDNVTSKIENVRSVSTE